MIDAVYAALWIALVATVLCIAVCLIVVLYHATIAVVEVINIKRQEIKDD